MNRAVTKAMAAGNNAATWLYRRTRGRIGGSAKGLPVLLLTVSGRKTGQPRTVPVTYFEHATGYLVAASARIVDGPERDELWREVVLAEAPFFANYEEKSGRTIPIALLINRPGDQEEQ